MTKDFAEIGGTQLYYEVAGAGPPFALVHAGVADRRMWDDQFGDLAAHYKMMRYDMRGFGQSPLGKGAFTHSEDLYDLLRFLGVERAYLMGCSKGGSVILDLALHHPEMAAALILVGSAPHGFDPSDNPPQTWSETDVAIREGDYERAADLLVRSWADGPKRDPEQVLPALRELMREMCLIALEQGGLVTRDERLPEPAAIARLAELRVPTLVIYGDMDAPAILAAGDMMADQIAGAQKVIIPGTGHLPNVEQPVAFNRIVLDFLRDLPTDQGE